MVPLHATVGDLKRASEAALRDTYCIAERLIVTDIKELMDVSDEEVLFGLIQSGVELCVRGIALTKRLWLLAFLALFGICHQWLLAFGQVKEHSEDSYVLFHFINLIAHYIVKSHSDIKKGS